MEENKMEENKMEENKMEENKSIEEVFNEYKEYLNVLFSIQLKFKTLSVSFEYMEKFEDENNILANLKQVKKYETYLIGILDSKIDSIITEINDKIKKIKEIKEITSDETTVLNKIESDTDKSLINLIKNLEILESIYLKYTKGKTSVYLNFMGNKKLFDAKRINIVNDTVSISCHNKNLQKFEISVDNVKINKDDKFLNNLYWENIKDKTTFLFPINFNIVGPYNVEKMLKDIIDKYSNSSIKLNRIIENTLDYDSKFTEMTDKKDTVQFIPSDFKGKQQILRTNQENIIILTKGNYTHQLEKIKRNENISHIFYEIEITNANTERRPQVETATIILCDTAILESPTEIAKSFYIDPDRRSLASPFVDLKKGEKEEKNIIKGNASYANIDVNKIDKKYKKIYENWNIALEPKPDQLDILNTLRTYIQDRVKEQIFTRESIKHLVKFLSNKNNTLSTMKNTELYLTNYEDYDKNTYVKTITEQDTTEITNIITELTSKKPYNFVVITNLKTSEPAKINEPKVIEFNCAEIKNMLELLDNIERT